MDNTFILKLQNTPTSAISWRMKILMRILKLFNRNNPYFEFSFKKNLLNELYRKQLGLVKRNMLRGNMISVEQGINLYHLLHQVVLMEVPGDIVELGCYEGTTALLLQMTLDQLKSERILHLYDSFQGMPEVNQIDGTRFKKGSLSSSLEVLQSHFNAFNIKLPKIHAGWFKDTLPQSLPEKIAFAHLDGDLYSSIQESLYYVYPRLSPNAIVVVDDYCDPTIHNVNNILPGVKKACDDFLADKPEKITVLLAGCEAHGYFRKI